MENSSSFEIRDRFLGRYTVGYTASIRIGYTANHILSTERTLDVVISRFRGF